MNTNTFTITLSSWASLLIEWVSEWVSEQIINGTSNKLRYTVPFTSPHAGKYVTKTDTTKTNTTQKKANNTKYSETKLVWFSRFLRHSARKRSGLILQRSRAHTGLINGVKTTMMTISTPRKLQMRQLIAYVVRRIRVLLGSQRAQLQ